MSLETLDALRAEHHGGCLACSDPLFRLDFHRAPAGVLVARLRPERKLCSYRGVIHGGVVGLLIDEAMTCCLMAHGVVAMTGELSLRYAAPVRAGEPIEVRTRVVTTFSPLYHVEGTLWQGGEVKVTALGRFLQHERAEA
jgi:uncharacterized protein (TIGR00369 family)